MESLSRAPIQNLAIIMDGNGRWAQRRGWPRSWGHVKGAQVARDIILECQNWGIQNLILYAFSTENWDRPESEVQFLMRLLKRYAEKYLMSLVEKGIRVQVVGQWERLPADVQQALNRLMQATSGAQGLQVWLAISYGGRQEIMAAVKALAQDVRRGILDPEELDERLFASRLWVPAEAYPDLIIRTSGEKRLSNFLLWQSAYAELVFQDVLWPDYTRFHLQAAFQEWMTRQRRFGRVNTGVTVPTQAASWVPVYR